LHDLIERTALLTSPSASEPSDFDDTISASAAAGSTSRKRSALSNCTLSAVSA
jgi:hypothetical protein